MYHLVIYFFLASGQLFYVQDYAYQGYGPYESFAECQTSGEILTSSKLWHKQLKDWKIDHTKVMCQRRGSDEPSGMDH